MSEQFDTTNDMTPIAEALWKLYSQLMMAGFTRIDALHITVEAFKSMTAGAMKS